MTKVTKDKISKIKKIISRCKQSPAYFIENFCYVKHPSAGVIPFRLFSYQQKCLTQFRHHRFNIFGKTRQSGISTLCGVYALWLAMFFKSKTILIVSKRDLDAKEFLIKNIKFVYDHLPQWAQLIWCPVVNNEHQFGFANGSKISSLPSGPETLRQYSSSLNIIDEAAFCPHMEEMWAGGYPTLQHGGSVIVISTSNGIGNWYWKTWTDAIEKYNEFNSITIDWWDMDWAIEYIDDVSGDPVRICPIDGIRECKTKEEKEKFGKLWSPWLETQCRSLTEKGDDSKFRQEVLRDFLGSGNTVLIRETLLIMRQQVKEIGRSFETVSHVDYVQPINNESYHLDFQDALWIWEKPIADHVYTMGADISSGEAKDWSAVSIFDITAGEQVAELQIKTKPKVFSVMLDYLGRWYNNAFLIPERNGMGVTVCQDLEDFAYPNIFRKGMIPSANKKTMINRNKGPIGYNTTGIGKPIINKSLIDKLGDNGFRIKSHRLLQQAETYVHLGANKTGAEKGSMNDDLVIAAGLAFVGVNLAVSQENCNLLPFAATAHFNKPSNQEPTVTYDFNAINPISTNKTPMPHQTQEDELQRFAGSLVIPLTDQELKPVISKKKKQLL